MVKQIDRKVEEILRSPIGCEFLLSVEASGLSPVEVGIPRNSLWLAAGAVEKLDWWRTDHAETVADALEHGERLRVVARAVLEHPATAWWFAPLDPEHQVWISHDKGLPDTANWQRPNSPPDRWERYAQKPRTGQYQCTSTLKGEDTSLLVAVDYGVGDFNQWSLPFECWGLLVPYDVQVFEVQRPADWNRLCVRYPATGETDGPPDPKWLVPDWGGSGGRLGRSPPEPGWAACCRASTVSSRRMEFQCSTSGRRNRPTGCAVSSATPADCPTMKAVHALTI